MIKRVIFGLIVGITIFACDNNNEGETAKKDAFDRKTMLVNWADNIIIPVFKDLNTKLADLQTAKNSFNQTPNTANLEALRATWLNAYKVWQSAEMFNIGEAERIAYVYQMNIYPTTVSKIDNNINSGTYDITHVNNNDAVGFPALDYLLYGVAATDNDIISIYTTNEKASNYKKYLSDLVDRMKSLTQTVLNNWTSTYRNDFISKTGNTSESSVNKVVNDFIFYYETILRSRKIGIPAGIYSSGNKYPNKVEAYYSKNNSKVLLEASLNSVQNFFNGKAYASTVTGNSLKAYLDYLKSITNGKDIALAITNQLNKAREHVQTLDQNFANQVMNDNTKMTLTFDELQKAVVLFKVDMVQAMNIGIDYVDSDGD